MNPLKSFLSVLVLLLVMSFAWLLNLNSFGTTKPTPNKLHPKATQVDLSPWIAYGDLRGHIEACGCDPVSDLGGVLRIAKFVKTQKGLNPKLWSFELGNSLSEKLDMNRSQVVESLFEYTQPTASLFNQLEMLHFENNFDFSSSRKFVLWNQKNINSNLVKRFVDIGNDLSVIGLIEPSQENNLYKKYVQKFTIDQVRDFMKKRGRSLIVLAHGSNEWIKSLWETKLFTKIIAANARPLGLEPDQLEKQKPGLLHVLQDVYRVPFFGQGILLSDKINTLESMSSKLNLFNSDSSPVLPENESFSFKQPELVQWLDISFEDKDLLKRPMKRFRAGLEGELTLFSKNKLSKKSTQLYAGAEACAGCHPSSYKVWKKSSHAHAFATLEKKHQHRNLECLECHVVGLKADSGFISQEATPQFKNVQCENCHGPRLKHIAYPSNKTYHDQKNAAKKVCVSCHHSPHSTAFNFESYWKKIKHK